MTTITGLIERNFAQAAFLAQAAAVPSRSTSSCCGLPLDGGPTVFWCPCGTTVPAADLDRETHAPLRGAR